MSSADSESLQGLLRDSLTDAELPPAAEVVEPPVIDVFGALEELSKHAKDFKALAATLLYAALRGAGAKPEDVSVTTYNSDGGGQLLRPTLRVYNKETLVGSVHFSVSDGPEKETGFTLGMTLYLSPEAVTNVEKVIKEDADKKEDSATN